MSEIRPYSELRVGDYFLGPEDVQARVVGEHEDTRDRFGRAMRRFWAVRTDTGKEGWVTYGPGGMVRT